MDKRNTFTFLEMEIHFLERISIISMKSIMSEANAEKEKEQLILFQDALEYYEESDLNDDWETLPRASSTSFSEHELLREEMLSELDSLKEILLESESPDLNALTDEERELFQRFINSYSTCPICGGFNHYRNLRDLFFGENEDLLQELLRLLTLEEEFSNVTFGIPCCNCYKKYLEE